MTDRPSSRAATDLLRQEKVDVGSPRPEVDARTIDAIRDAIEAQATARRYRAFGGGALAAAALVAVFYGARALLAPHPAAVASVVAARVTVTGHAVAGGVVLLHDGKEMPLDGGSAIVVGDRIVAASGGRAAISLSTGSHVIVESGADMTVVSQDATQIFELRAGSVRADVAKLAPNERFLVRTPDAEVEVRGTSFRVALVDADPSCGGGTPTRVVVSEGVVSVRSNGIEAKVPAATSWPPSCAVAAIEAANVVPVPEPTVRPPPASSTTPPEPPPTAAHGSTPTLPALTPSELAEQNRLYGEATAAKRNGDTAKAIDLYDGFMKKYPSSFLGESAAVERMRLLNATDHARARDAARAYLARYPHGFARDEADEIASP